MTVRVATPATLFLERKHLKLISSATRLADVKLFEDIVYQHPAGLDFAGGFHQLGKMSIGFSPNSSSK